MERSVYAKHIQIKIMIILLIAVIIGIIIVVRLVKTYNKVAGMKVKIEESQSDMETYLIKRYDVLTESVKAISNFKEYEEGIIDQVIKESLESQDKAINQIMALKVPEITSSELYVKFQTQLSEENGHVAASKRMYNANVSTYNQYIAKFPVNMLGYRRVEFLKDESVENKKEVNIDWKE